MPANSLAGSKFERDAHYDATHNLADLVALRSRCRSSIVAVNAGGDRRDVRIDGGKVSPTAQHLMAIVVLGGLAGDQSQPTLLQFGLRFISRIDRTKGA
jgi:hypothetical protein